jgi:hypothetical protein
MHGARRTVTVRGLGGRIVAVVLLQKSQDASTPQSDGVNRMKLLSAHFL